ncbi:MAG: hypothetical protein QW727_04005 [Candidatus Pacearchaeota archaeon]
MALDYLGVNIATILGVIGIILLITGFLTSPKKKDKRKVLFLIGAGGLLLGAIPSFYSMPSMTSPLFEKTFVSLPNTQNQQNPVVVTQNYQPTATYATIDRFSTTSVSGISYYSSGNNPFTTSAITNTDPNLEYTYWVSNETYYVEPIKFQGGGTKNIVNDQAYRNGTLTMTAYDLVQKQKISEETLNSSMGANKNAQVELTILGNAKTSALPFGGVMVVEFNSTIPTASCAGDGISQNTGTDAFQVTYTPSFTSSRYLVYKVEKGYDVSSDGGNTGRTRNIRCDFTNGATSAENGLVYVTFIPANYYIASDKKIYLDVEQKMSGSTTRTGNGLYRFSWRWGA